MGLIWANMRAETPRMGTGTGLWAPVLVGWALCAVPALVALVTGGGAVPLSTDDAMRLVQVRDLLAGQGWFDLVQARLGPEGTEMHWSRLVDAPIAALIWLVAPLLGTAEAERAVSVFWPLLTLLPAVLAMAASAGRQGGVGAAWAAAVLTGALLSHAARHNPGALDHHNVQLTLLAVVLAGLLSASSSPRWAALAGGAMAISLAVGIEMVPILAILGAAFALAAVLVPGQLARAAVALGLSFAATLALLFVATAPASAYRGGHCDALSVDMALPAILGALGLAGVAATLCARPVALRLGALLAVGAVALAAAALVAPACFTNPVDAIDPFLRAAWLDNVAETRSLVERLAEGPGPVVPVLVAALAGAVSAMVLIRRDPAARTGWAMLLAGLVAAFAIAAYQVRGLPALSLFAVLPVAVLGPALLREGRARGLAGIALLLLAVPGVSGAVASAMPAPARAPGNDATSDPVGDLFRCYEDDVLGAFAALPPGLVSASSNLGAHILLESPQRVLSAPYHRNEAGMIAQIRIALAEPAEAEVMLRDLGVDYVALCGTDPETRYPADTTHPGLFPALGRDEVPAYLTPLPVPPGSPLRLYAVTPG
ncbi:MAG: hypothetical protein ACTS11_01195 [Roseicyclus sp.]